MDTAENSSFLLNYEDYDMPDEDNKFHFHFDDVGDETSHTDASMSTTYPCYSLGELDFDFLENVDYILNGVIGLPCAILGIVINIFCLIILLKPRLRKVLFNQLLIGLACVNLLSLFARIIRILDKTFHIKVYFHIALFPYLIYPMAAITVTATIFMTVAIVHERYTVASGKSHIRSISDNKKKLAIYIGTVTLTSLLFNLPKFFEVTWVQSEELSFLMPTRLRTNPYYSVYYICLSRLIFWKVLPSTLILFFCFKIYRASKPAAHFTDNHTQVKTILANERQLSLVFLTMVLAFFISYLPATILNINEAMSINQLVYCHDHNRNGIPLWVLTMTDISNFCVFIFSSINLLFVMLPNSGYRKHCRDFFTCGGNPRNMESSDGTSQDEMTQIEIADPESCEFETQFEDQVITKTTRAVANRETQRDKFVTSEIINL